jgi:hypothetical protein
MLDTGHWLLATGSWHLGTSNQEMITVCVIIQLIAQMPLIRPQGQFNPQSEI